MNKIITSNSLLIQSSSLTSHKLSPPRRVHSHSLLTPPSSSITPPHPILVPHSINLHI